MTTPPEGPRPRYDDEETHLVIPPATAPAPTSPADTEKTSIIRKPAAPGPRHQAPAGQHQPQMSHPRQGPSGPPPMAPPAPRVAHSAPPAPAPHRPSLNVPGPQAHTEQDLIERFTGAVRAITPNRPTTPPPDAATIGRSSSNTFVVNDPLASRVHAYLQLTSAGVQIRDNNSGNGTFVNGQRITKHILRDGDVITIGNTDLELRGNTLIPHTATPDSTGVSTYGLSLAIDGRTLLDNIAFNAKPGTLTAVIGPSGAGKSTFIKLVGGNTTPTNGVVTFDGHNVHTEYASLRSRIGLVPQDDVVHRQLTVQKALSYAAQLRLPSDTSRTDRQEVIERVLAELELTQHRNTRIDKLSGGQRKRASVAMELLTGPSLLILDEPTSGLDPALDRQVMTMLRSLADAGRVVIVVTHSLTYLNMCDQVLLLAPGGKTAFAGPPDRISHELGTTDWADIFQRVSADPDGAHRNYQTHHPSPPSPPAPPPPGHAPQGEPPHTSGLRQFWTVARRQARLIAADRGYFIFLAILPFVLGGLALLVPGETGLGVADPRGSAPSEPNQILILLNLAVVFMGTALTVRDLVGERLIFQREQAVGLSSGAYLFAKVLVYSIAATLQTAILTAVVIAGKGGPTQGAVLLGNPSVELYLSLAATAVVSAILGLALSSLAKSTEQVVVLLVLGIMLSIVFSGGLIPVTGRAGLQQLSGLVPARWGFAAAGSVADLRKIGPLVQNDVLWTHTASWWLLDMGMLLTLGAILTGFIIWRLRLPAGAGSTRENDNTFIIKVLALAIAVAAIVAGIVISSRSHTDRPDAMDWPTLPPAPPTQSGPPQPTLAATALPGTLLTPEAIGQILKATGLTAEPLTAPVNQPTVSPEKCGESIAAAHSSAYTSTPAPTFAAQGVHETAQPWTHDVVQTVAAFPDAKSAQAFQDAQTDTWASCADNPVTVDGKTATLANVGNHHGVLTVGYTFSDRPDWQCQRAILPKANIIVDVSACAPGLVSQTADIARRIADGINP
ncbi:ABC transporter ATP-binding protein [Mycobacteroides abscessus subsp. abscessus]|uniref:ATP-binding cassette domain-containing protein n=1 Tax=Mycobacteroides abscessus TaxID=36809 RepID=UPI0009287DD6|nr:ABC transporter ATP-binding protein [Mycobacteroides abscessus subsp. abscessus]